MKEGYKPSALLVSESSRSTHSSELIAISGLNEKCIFTGNAFKDPSVLNILKNMDLDYIFGIHFPYIIPQEMLELPKIGFLNLHPAYLPFNKGWHTPSWAILDQTPYGATLHFMAEALDEGDIIHQKELKIKVDDTADSLYQKVLQVEEEVFVEAFDHLVSMQPKRFPQKHQGSSHNKKDLKDFQEINLNEKIMPIKLIDHLRALSTNNKSEAAYFIVDGKKIGVRVQLFEMENN